MPQPRAGRRRSLAASLRRAARQFAIALIAALAVSVCQWDDPVTRTLTFRLRPPAAPAHGGLCDLSFDDDRDDPPPIKIAAHPLADRTDRAAALRPAPAHSFTDALSPLDCASDGCGFLRESVRRN